MANAQGTKESLYIGREASFKVMAVPANGSKLAVTQPSIQPNRNKFQSQSLTGVPEPRPVVTGKNNVQGNFTTEMNESASMPVLDGIMGGYRRTGTPLLYTHEYTLDDAPPLYMAQYHADLGLVFLWNGVYLSTANLNFEAEGLMAGQFGIMGARQTLLGPAANITDVITGTLTDRTGFDTFSYLLVRIVKDGAVIGYSQSVQFTINRQLGSENAQDETDEVAVIYQQIPTIEGKMTILFQNRDMFDLAQAGTEMKLEVFLPNGKGVGLWVECPTIKLRPMTTSTQGTGLIKAEAMFDVYARGDASSTYGQLRSGWFTAPPDLTGLQLTISKNGAADVVVNFAGGDNTPELVRDKINAGIAGLASVERMAGETGGLVLLKTSLAGPTGSVFVKPASTAAVALGYDTTAANFGLRNRSIIMRLLNKIAA